MLLKSILRWRKVLARQRAAQLKVSILSCNEVNELLSMVTDVLYK